MQSPWLLHAHEQGKRTAASDTVYVQADLGDMR